MKLSDYWKNICNFNDTNQSIKSHLRGIIREELENYYIIFHPEIWIMSNNNHDQGVENTHWDFSKYLEDLNDNISNIYNLFYNGQDPERSLIDFLETNYSALDILIDWLNTKTNNKIKLFSDPVNGLKEFSYLFKKFIDVIVFPPDKDIIYPLPNKNTYYLLDNNIDSPFKQIIKSIIFSKSKGKYSTKKVSEDLINKGYVVKLTKSGDLVDIKNGIDLIILSPDVLKNKTMQIKNIKNIDEFPFVFNIYCGDLQNYTVDFYAFYHSVNDKIYYFFNDKDNVFNKKNHYCFRKYETATNDLINLKFNLII